MKHPEVKNFINGQFVTSASNRFIDVECPLNGEVIANLRLSNSDDLNQAVRTAKEAQKLWEKVPIKERVQVFYKYKQLLEVGKFSEFNGFVDFGSGLSKSLSIFFYN